MFNREINPRRAELCDALTKKFMVSQSSALPKFYLAALVALPIPAHSATKSEPVTFNKHIAPIIYKNCSACHRPDEAAPFALLSYQDVVRKAKTIGKATASRAMPPWKAEPSSYPYRDERRLTDEQIARDAVALP